MTRNELLPCPFCGEVGVTCREGSTYRWVIAECDSCGATAGEVRKNTLSKDRDAAQAKAESDAIAQWNTRSLRDVGVTDANFAFEEGWRLAAEWAKRDDLVSDIGSPAYIRDRDAMLFKAAPSGDEE